MFKEVRGWSIHKLLCDERGPPKLVHRYQLAIMFGDTYQLIIIIMLEEVINFGEPRPFSCSILSPILICSSLLFSMAYQKKSSPTKIYMNREGWWQLMWMGELWGPTGAAVTGVEEVGGAVGIGEADAGRSFQEQEVGH